MTIHNVKYFTGCVTSEYVSMLLALLKLLRTQVWTLCLCPFLRYHNCAHYDHTDGERPLLPAASICHQGVRRLLLDLLCVCVCSTHWVCFCSLQCWLPAQRKGQSEGQQAQLWGEKNIPIMHSQCTGNNVVQSFGMFVNNEHTFQTQKWTGGLKCLYWQAVFPGDLQQDNSFRERVKTRCSPLGE